MTWLVLSAKKETKGPKTTSGQQQENSRLFMDDLTTTTETIVQSSYLLRKLEIIFDWAGLDFKQEKCRALIIIKRHSREERNPAKWKTHHSDTG